MLTFSFSKGHRQWLRLLHLIQPLGFCHTCQRPTAWLDHGTAFRCRHCGRDPLTEASETCQGVDVPGRAAARASSA